MGAGLAKSLVPILVAGGIDTKNDPRLVQPGSLLELENMWQLRPGELRFRNGFSALPQIGNGTGFGANAGVLYPTAQGTLASIANVSTSQAPAPLKLAGTNWIAQETAQSLWPYPLIKAAVTGIESKIPINQSGPSDLTDPDICVSGNTAVSTWVEGGSISSALRWASKDLPSGALLIDVDGGATTNGAPAVACSSGGYLCLFTVASVLGPAFLSATVFSSATLNEAVYNGVVTDVAGSPGQWIDAKAIPGTSLIAVAYRASGGGVTCFKFDPSTGAATNIVNTPAADASMCLGWMDNSLGGSLWLATAGSGSGIVVRAITQATMAVNTTDVIDATATANVRNITGHITGANQFAVLWTISGSPTYLDVVRIGRWNLTAATVTDLAPSFSLYSRTAKFPDGHYYFVGAYDSTVQPAYAVIGAYQPDGLSDAPVSQCQFLTGEGGGRRVAASSLASIVTVGSTVVMAAAKKTKIATPTGTAAQGRAVQQVTFSMANATGMFRRPRELGGTMFIPGGLIGRDDGHTVTWATCPFFPEAPTLVSSATGSMTASGAYAYREVLRRTDSTGRVTRSAGSTVTPITLGAGDGRVTITVQNPRLPIAAGENYVIDHYRSGPAAAGATNYNKVGESYGNWTTGSTLTFVDSMSDANAALGEILYSTGNVLENFQPPACNLLEVCGPRVWLVSAEDQTILWYSKEYKPGAGIGFNPALTIKVTGDGYGGITALAAMDGRLIAFKSSAIYVISGDGPTDAGQGSFNPPQAVSLSVGTVLPGSVVATPDGIMFQSAAGIYLLDRGLGLSYLGKPVEKYTLAENVVDASLVTGQTQVRFVMPSGRCLVYNYDQKHWSTFLLRTDGSPVVACANPASGWCYALSNGIVMQETSGVYSDVMNGTSTGIVPRIGFPYLNLAGINGYQRCYGIQILGEYVGDCLLNASLEFDYSGTTDENYTKVITAGPFEYEIKLRRQKTHSMRLTLTCGLNAGSGGFRLSAVTALVGVKKGSKLPPQSRMT